MHFLIMLTLHECVFSGGRVAFEFPCTCLSGTCLILKGEPLEIPKLAVL